MNVYIQPLTKFHLKNFIFKLNKTLGCIIYWELQAEMQKEYCHNCIFHFIAGFKRQCQRTKQQSGYYEHVFSKYKLRSFVKQIIGSGWNVEVSSEQNYAALYSALCPLIRLIKGANFQFIASSRCGFSFKFYPFYPYLTLCVKQFQKLNNIPFLYVKQ